MVVSSGYINWGVLKWTSKLPPNLLDRETNCETGQLFWETYQYEIVFEEEPCKMKGS